MKTKIQVQHLRKGDQLTNCKVFESPFETSKTPPGKVAIGVEYLDGTRKIQHWGKHTKVTVTK